MKFKGKVCCFIGHRIIELTDDLRERLTNTIEKLIQENGVQTFLFGSKSQFDDLCYDVVTELKKKHPDIQRIYVRAEYLNMSRLYAEELLAKYEDTYYLENIEGSSKDVYVKRNIEMMDKSDICIFYYKEDYHLYQKKGCSPNSGTKIAYEYANNKRKSIYNLL